MDRSPLHVVAGGVPGARCGGVASRRRRDTFGSSCQHLSSTSRFEPRSLRTGARCRRVRSKAAIILVGGCGAAAEIIA